jgi:hypothetical protein
LSKEKVVALLYDRTGAGANAQNPNFRHAELPGDAINPNLPQYSNEIPEQAYYQQYDGVEREADSHEEPTQQAYYAQNAEGAETDMINYQNITPEQFAAYQAGVQMNQQHEGEEENLIMPGYD